MPYQSVVVETKAEAIPLHSGSFQRVAALT